MKTRLLSPNKQRIYPNARTGAGISRAGTTVKTLRDGLDEGTPDEVTWLGLKKLGWTEYEGPARTDERGYIIPGTDPDLGGAAIQ